MRVLVYGGAGFLGSSLNFLLRRKGLEPYIFDNFTTGKKSFFNNEFEIIEGDICNSEEVDSSFENIKPEIVIHLAAIHHIPTAESNPVETLKVNLNGTCNILNTIEKRKFKGKFGFASTGGVYKDLGDESLNELSVVDPIGIYTLSKYYCEQIIEYYKKQRNCNFQPTIFRLFNLVGKNETNDHLLPAILEQLLKSDHIKHGNLSPKRDYIHVDDASSLITKWAKEDINKTPQYLNVCSNQQYSVREVINICKEVAGKDLPLIQDRERVRKSDRLNQKGDRSLAKTLYNWAPEKSLYNGISDLWKDLIKR